MTDQITDAQKDSSELASEQGFSGTFGEFLEWLTDSLVYGSIRVHEPALNDFGVRVTRVETVTGGYSSDEHLLSRLRRSLWLATHWVMSERGGLVVYEFPDRFSTSDETREWLEPDNGRLETLYRARRVRVYDRHGGYTELNYPTGAELLFQEPERDINEPDGLLIVRPLIEEVAGS